MQDQMCSLSWGNIEVFPLNNLGETGLVSAGSRNKSGIYETANSTQFSSCNTGPAVFTEETLKASFLQLGHCRYGDSQYHRCMVIPSITEYGQIKSVQFSQCRTRCVHCGNIEGLLSPTGPLWVYMVIGEGALLQLHRHWLTSSSCVVLDYRFIWRLVCCHIVVTWRWSDVVTG